MYLLKPSSTSGVIVGVASWAGVLLTSMRNSSIPPISPPVGGLVVVVVTATGGGAADAGAEGFFITWANIMYYHKWE